MAEIDRVFRVFFALLAPLQDVVVDLDELRDRPRDGDEESESVRDGIFRGERERYLVESY